MRTTTAFAIASWACSMANAGWKPVAAPLMTRWAKDVTPTQVPPYPRPQLVRPPESWASLNGLWLVDYNALDLSSPPFGNNSMTEEILVPYPLESPLSGVRKLAPHFCMWYRRVFQPAELLPTCNGKKVLRFERVDWNTTVFVNGRLLGTHLGGYDSFSYAFPPTTETGTGTGTGTEIIVGVYDATEMNPRHWQPYGKQQRAAFTNPSGMMYTSSSGIWDTVWLECVPDLHIEDVYLIPDVADGTITVEAELVSGASAASTQSTESPAPFHSAAPSQCTIEVVVYDGKNKTIATARSGGCASKTPLIVKIPPADLKLWSPSYPHLFNVTITLLTSKSGGGGSAHRMDATPTDVVRSYVGMRSIGVGLSKVTGKPAVYLNSRELFQTGVLDQGFFPDGGYTAATDDALVSDLLALKAMGFNAVRKHMKVDTRRWFYHADTLGLLVWQDIPQWNSGDGDFDAIFAPEVRNIWKGIRNSPSLIQWNAFNEGWGEGSPAMSNKTVALFRSLEGRTARDGAADGGGGNGDGGSNGSSGGGGNQGGGGLRLINDASGGRGFGCQDGWVDPNKCPSGSRCEAVFWTGGCAGDVTDHHHYPNPEVPYDLAEISARQGKPFLQGEYGGYSLGVDGHDWCKRDGASSGTPVATTPLPDPGLTSAFEQYAAEAALLHTQGLSGIIFTQMSDCECEMSGLLTYDRVPKVNYTAIRLINEALLRNVSTKTAPPS